MIFRLFKHAIDFGITTAVTCLPKNLRQHYADKLMYMKVCIEFGVTADL